MSEMIERVARALSGLDEAGWAALPDHERQAIAIWRKSPRDASTYPPPNMDYKYDYLDMARAALAAMKEPTPKMCEAGDDGHYGMSPQDVWQAMITAALQEEKDG